MRNEEEHGLPRRSFLEKLLIATGVISGTATVGSAYAASGSKRPIELPSIDTHDVEDALGVGSKFEPAKSMMVQEVSRHPTALPSTADYTLYNNGEYQRVVTRTDPRKTSKTRTP